MTAKHILCLLPALVLLLPGCNPPDSGQAAPDSGSVKINASTSVRINGKPVARADSAALVDGACAAGVLQKSPNVKVNGKPATVVSPGVSAAACTAPAGVQSSPNVQVGN